MGISMKMLDSLKKYFSSTPKKTNRKRLGRGEKAK